MANENIDNKNFKIWHLTNSDKYHTIEELFKKSQSNSIYYVLLALSSLIVASGLLLNNSTIVIGGMLVTPLLSPILLIALGISVGEIKVIKSSAILVLKSVLIIAGLSFLLAVLFGKPAEFFLFGDSLRVAVLYFFVAFVSGVAATIAWTRKEIGEILPGIAIAVSLVPPLSLSGISLSAWDLDLSRLSLLMFIFNLAGIILGSIIVFSLLKFYKTDKVVQKEAAAQEVKK